VIEIIEIFDKMASSIQEMQVDKRNRLGRTVEAIGLMVLVFSLYFCILRALARAHGGSIYVWYM
jgi:hypothetical protein